MSDDVLKIIPKNPDYVPSDQSQVEAVAALEKLLPDGEMCNAEVYQDMNFIDCGENLESVICPECGAKTEIDYFAEEDPGLEWWYHLNDLMEDNPVPAIEVAMPCCGKKIQFMDVKFNWPCGFARFELSIYNPNISENLSKSELQRFEIILGCELIQVRAHY